MDKRCTANIEKMAVNAVDNEVSKRGYMLSYIDNNDKTQSWDGCINIYNKPECTKSDWIGKIDVQVKGTTKVVKKNKINYSMEVVDLKNYFEQGGVILFVVYISEDDSTKIYYNSLTPIELRKYLEKAGANKTISIETKELPSSKQSLWHILKNHCVERDKQHKKVFLNLEDLNPQNCKALEVDIITEPENTEKYILGNEFPVYAIDIINQRIPLIQKIKFFEISRNVDIPVYVNEKKYFDYYQIIKKKDCEIIKIGKDIQLNLTTKEITADTNDNIYEIIKDIKFLIDATKFGSIKIGHINIAFMNNDSKKQKLLDLKGRLRRNEKIVETFEHLGVNFDVEFEKLNSKDCEIINQLTSMYEGKFNYVGDFGVRRLNIGGKQFCIIILPDDNKKYAIENYFGDFYKRGKVFTNFEGKEYDEENMVETTPYILLQAEDIVGSTNFNSNSIMESIKRIEKNEKQINCLTNTVVQIIKAFDISQNSIHLKLALDVVEELLIKDKDHTYNNINRLQILKRMRALNKSEKTQLYEMKNDEKDDFALTAISILLENKSDFEICFEKMNEAQRNEFAKFPIFTLAKQTFNL